MFLYIKKILVLIFLLGFTNGCSTINDNILEKKILTPESIEIYDITIENFYVKPSTRARLLQKFPFISNEPILNFNGKFSNQFYDKLNYSYKSTSLKNVNFWQLRTNPFSQDFIYILPTWIEKFKRVSNDLYENIAYSYNLSNKEQEILKWWIGEGGILWVEGGVYSTRYDTFNSKGKLDSKALYKKIIKKSTGVNFFNHKIHSYVYQSKKIDFINYAPLTLKFKTASSVEYFKDIKNIKIKTKNFLSTDFLPYGTPLLYVNIYKPLVSFIPYGKGGVVFIRPFEFEDKRYDGELLRWKIIYYLLHKMYINTSVATVGVEKEIVYPKKNTTKKRVEKKKKIVLHKLQFKTNSYQLKKSSYKLLKPIANDLVKHENLHCLIAGHTDYIGTKIHNEKLSKSRADNVKQILITMGVDMLRLQTKGYGYSQPIGANKTKAGRALNRRVEFIITNR